MIVSCGEALVDLVPHPVPGGGPMNVAVAAARLGAPAAFVGRVSSDDYGQTIWSYLRENGVDLRAAERGDEATAKAIVEHVPELRFRFEGDGTADTLLSAASLESLGGGPHILHGGTLGLFRGRTAEVLAGLMERHDGLVSFDPNVRPQIIDDRERWDHYHGKWARRSQIYRVSEEDAEWIWPTRDAASWAAEMLDGRADVVVLTRGGGGVEVFTERFELHVNAREVEVVDTVGAGDTFVASTLVSIWNRGLAASEYGIRQLTQHDWQQIVLRAADAAAITCSRRGADPPTLEDLERA